MVKNIQFTAPVRNVLQDKLRKDIKEVNKDSKVFVKADKTANHYKVGVEDFEKLIEKSIHSDYKKADEAKVIELCSLLISQIKILTLTFSVSTMDSNHLDWTVTLRDKTGLCFTSCQGSVRSSSRPTYLLDDM